MLDNFNKSLFKRVVKLPNVSEFVALKTGLHEYALMYGIEKVKRIKHATKLYESDKANKYLEHQARRLSRYAANGEMEKFDALSQMILRRSRTFRLLALNRVLPDWFCLRIDKLKGLWMRLSKICWNLSSDLKFKRVWIDKKPGDFARPLGVPSVEWRALSYMRMDHLERGLKARGILQPFQHGGRSGVGVLTAWKDLIPRLKTSRFIYEFDLKGFFDNVLHNAILRIIGSQFGLEAFHWTLNVLKSKPQRYILPSEEDDPAKGDFRASMENWDDELDFTPPEHSWRDGEAPKMINHPIFGMIPEMVLPEDIEDEEDRRIRDAALNPNSMDIYYDELTGEKIILNRRPYGSFEIMDVKSKITEEERAIVRDKWKNLGQEGKGVPQGLGTSPLLSTILTDTYLKSIGERLIMYMDDGLIFANSKEELNETITKMKNLCKSFGVEIAEEKSGVIKEDDKWIKSSRFLGLRYIPERDTIQSDTRTGTQMEFPARASWDEIKEILKVEGMNVSDTKRKYEKLINLKAYEAGLKYGFLGCLISESQYKDLKPLDERRLDILTGQLRSWANIQKSKSGIIWKYQDMFEVKMNLTNASSIAVYKFLRFIRRRGKFGWR